MPQMNKGGKFIFGQSEIHSGYKIILPPQAVSEYDISCEGRVYLFTGSKSAGGFCVTRRELLLRSKIGNILEDNPNLSQYSMPPLEFVKYKGRSYFWAEITADGIITLNEKAAEFLGIEIGMKLLSIRSSDIAFTMGAKGPLIEKAINYNGEIPLF